jgi:hypothetical protein
MKDKKLDILLEHLFFIQCKYHLKEDGGGTYCERAWADTDRACLRVVFCDGCISKCELTENDVMRHPEKKEK